MTSKITTWLEQTTKIFKGVLLYSFAGILYSILDPINNVTSAVGALSSFADSGKMSFGGPGVLDIICYLMLAGIIVGYILFLQGIKGFSELQEEADKAALNKIRIGTILILIGTAVDFIPFLGWVAGILNIIAFIMMIMGYSALKNSTTFPEKARSGASSLFVAMILLIVGAVVGFIPIAGGFIEMVLDIIAFVLILTGWAKIKNTTPNTNLLD